MQIDQVYLKGLLEAFQAAPGPLTDIEQLEAAGFPYSEPQFVFHMEILDDKGLIAQPDGDPGFGLFRGIDGTASWSVLPLRLTAGGHDFLEALRDKRIWARIQKDFKSAGISTLMTIAKTMLESLTKQALGVS